MSIDVIIIDDDPTSIFLHQVVVKKTGLTMSPLGFSSGWDALDHLDALEHWDNPCILLVDIDMPGMSGWELLEQINLRSYAEWVSAIIISSSTDLKDRKKARICKRVIGYLEKPIDVMRLQNELHSLDELSHSKKKNNSIKGLMLVVLFTLISVKLFIVSAQPLMDPLAAKFREKVRIGEDSVSRPKPRKYPVYKGGELSLSFPQSVLKSKIAQLDGLRASYIGTNVGGLISNAIGKLKANAGMYYSEPSVPYTMEMFQGSVSANAYLLRLKNVKYHTLEPYGKLGFAFQRTKFYGNYILNSENNNAPQGNYSSTEQPLLGKTGMTLLNTAIGFEYQLEARKKLFVHLFTEIEYGILLSSKASNEAFSGTKLSNPTTISLGIGFGVID